MGGIKIESFTEDEKEKVRTKSVFLAILGRPNAGKSSLLNMLMNKKISIVCSKPQTTRSRVNGILTDEDTQVVFMDIPGFLEPKTVLDDCMEKEIDNAIKGADAYLYLVEAKNELSRIDKIMLGNLKKLEKPALVAINKIDLVKHKSSLLEQIKELGDIFDNSEILLISAKTGYGKQLLLDRIKGLAKPSIFYFPSEELTDQSVSKMVEEIVREKTLYFLDKEVPHGIAVFVESMNERKNNLVTINATILCERDSHKGIIIGKGGSMLKKIGTFARADIEKNLGKKVNLKLWVKVKENWKNREGILRELGYID